MVRVELKNLTEFQHPGVKVFDIHEDFGLVCLVDDEETWTIYLNDSRCPSWLREDHPFIHRIKWFDADHVALALAGPEVAIVSAESCERHHLGYLDELYLSPKFMFATYGDEAFYSSRPNEVESNIISVFLRDGTFELGIRVLMDKDRDAWKFEQVTAGYTFNDEFRFIAWDSPLLWILNVSEKSWKKVPFSFSMGGIEVLTGDENKAYAIYDHRRLLQCYPDLPPFELAVFDLASETSAKKDFAPVEAALTAAGFVMSEIKFQPNSTGRIIVSDGNKAALLEFDGLE